MEDFTDPRIIGETAPEKRQRWIVKKFGGTSIGKYATSIARDIIPYV